MNKKFIAINFIIVLLFFGLLFIADDLTPYGVTFIENKEEIEPVECLDIRSSLFNAHWFGYDKKC